MFGKKTVDSIIRDITLKIEQLHAVHAAHHAAADAHMEVVLQRSKLATELVAEGNRAKAIAEKLTGLIS